jgi:hypothetical protein
VAAPTMLMLTWSTVVAGRGLTHTDSWVTEQGRLLGISDMCGEAGVLPERTSVGLDVHARSVTAAAIDGVTGELSRRSRPRPTTTSESRAEYGERGCTGCRR